MQARNVFSLIDLKTVSLTEVQDLFSLAETFKKQPIQQKYQGRVAALLFFEASTRTRMSFEMAAVQLGMHPMILSGSQATSLEKGESYLDTVLNVQAMRPSVLVIRSGSQLDMMEFAQMARVPVINAGWGVQGHPTQALLDAATLQAKFQSLRSIKLLIVGDVKHSRVARSHVELGRVLGYEVGFCGPESFLPKKDSADFAGVRFFDDLNAGLRWCDGVMALRVQLERHEKKNMEPIGTSEFSAIEYAQNFGLSSQKIDAYPNVQFVMHPGPINRGVEMDEDIISAPKSLIMEQVAQGVYVRQALLSRSQNDLPKKEK